MKISSEISIRVTTLFTLIVCSLIVSNGAHHRFE